METKWWQKSVVYQIYPRSFCDSNNDGIGDINGIRSKLDYLEKLGIEVIWLSPVYCSPNDDNGYDISDYYDISPEFGTLDEMKALLKEAKAHHIKIIMDLVVNHTSDEHKWFIEAKINKNSKYRDYYIWRKGENNNPPNDLLSCFGGSAWAYDETSQEYYLHFFSKRQPDLNWENKEVRQALFDAANFWLDKGVRGFRIDAIVYIKKPSEFKDLPVDGADNLASIAKATTYQDGILDFLHEFREKVFDRADIFTVAEADGVYPSDFDKWIGENGAFDMSFDFSHIRLGFDEDCTWHKRKSWKLIDIRKCFTEDEEATKDNGWVPVYFENHDLPRCTNYFFPQGTDTKLAAKFIATILLTMRGTPFIYEGQELGMTNIKWPSIKMYNDISSIGQYELALKDKLTPKEAMKGVWKYSRDNARSPMTWNSGSKAGFTTGRPWLPLNDEYPKLNVEIETEDENSVLNYYKNLIKLRKQYPALIEGDYEELLSYSPGIYAYARTTKDKSERIIVIANTTAKIRGYKIPELKGATLLASTYGNREATLLRSYEVRVYKVKK